MGELIEYCTNHSLRDAGQHFQLSHSTICERLGKAGFGKMLASAKQAQAALARFGIASDGRVRRIGSPLEQLTAIQGDTLGLALGIMQRVRTGQAVHIEEREFALKVLTAEAQQIAIATAVQEKLYMVRSAKAILGEIVDVIRSCSEPTKRELHTHMLHQAEKRGLFGATRPFAGTFAPSDGEEIEGSRRGA